MPSLTEFETLEMDWKELQPLLDGSEAGVITYATPAIRFIQNHPQFFGARYDAGGCTIKGCIRLTYD